MKKISLVVLVFLLSAFRLNAQLSTAFTDRLQFVLDSICNHYNIKGASAAVLVPNAGLWKGTHGESGTGQPITTDMLFGINSNTKTYVSTLMLRLQELGYINMNDTIGTWIQNQPNINGQITIKQLLNHTSGLYSFTDTSAFFDSCFSDPARIWQPEQMLQFVYAPYFAPGTGWHYSNTNYVLAGLIIKQIMNQPLSASLSAYVFNPAALSNTIFFPQQTSTAPGPDLWSTWFSGSYLEDIMTTYGYENNAMFSMAYSAGAIMATAEDNAQFWHKLISGQIINATSLNEMMQYVDIGISYGRPVGYGLGIFRYQDMPIYMYGGHTIYEHGGTNMGFINENCVDSVTGVTITVLTNQDSIDNSILFANVMPALHKVTMQMSATAVESASIKEQDIHVYPNPGSDIIYVRVDNNDKPLVLDLYDMYGRKVISKTFQGSTEKIIASQLSVGNYIITITTNGNLVHTQKLQIN
jgi:D-alanyl-D-alanine carboxypeptidase